MSSLDSSSNTFPEGTSNFNDKDKKNWNANLEKSRQRVAANVKHLVVGVGPWKRPKRKWNSVAWKQYLDGKDPSLDDMLGGAAPLPGAEVQAEYDHDMVLAEETDEVDIEDVEL